MFQTAGGRLNVLAVLQEVQKIEGSQFIIGGGKGGGFKKREEIISSNT